MSDEIKKTIDIDDILRSKLGDKAKHIPHFAVGWLKKIVHQDEVNQFLCDNKDLTGTKWLEACVKYLDVSLEVIGRENLPNQQDGRLYIFASNHPLGGADGVALGTIIGRRYDGHIKYLLNDLLMNLPGLRPLSSASTRWAGKAAAFPHWWMRHSKATTTSSCSPQVSVPEKSMVRFGTFPGRKHSSTRVSNTGETWCPFILTAETQTGSIASPTSVTP